MRRFWLIPVVLLVPSLVSTELFALDPGPDDPPPATLPEMVFLEGTPTSAGRDEIHLLVLQDMVMIDERGPIQGWYARRYEGSFRIHECLEDGGGNAVPGEFRGRGRVLSLRTRENPNRGIVRFEGDIVIDEGLPPFDISGYPCTVQGQFAGIDPEGPPWNRLNCNARFMGDLVATDELSWSNLKRRFR
ncbi:MAG: hypothetical protein ABIK65_15450 [Candidatus Eisenbacteria bacterium]